MPRRLEVLDLLRRGRRRAPWRAPRTARRAEHRCDHRRARHARAAARAWRRSAARSAAGDLLRVGGDVLRVGRVGQRRAVAVEDLRRAARAASIVSTRCGRGGAGVVAVVEALQLDQPAADDEQQHAHRGEAVAQPAVEPAEPQRAAARRPRPARAGGSRRPARGGRRAAPAGRAASGGGCGRARGGACAAACRRGRRPGGGRRGGDRGRGGGRAAVTGWLRAAVPRGSSAGWRRVVGRGVGWARRGRACSVGVLRSARAGVRVVRSTLRRGVGCGRWRRRGFAGVAVVGGRRRWPSASGCAAATGAPVPAPGCPARAPCRRRRRRGTPGCRPAPCRARAAALARFAGAALAAISVAQLLQLRRECRRRGAARSWRRSSLAAEAVFSASSRPARRRAAPTTSTRTAAAVAARRRGVAARLGARSRELGSTRSSRRLPDPFGGAQAHRRGARVGGDLGLAGRLGAAGQQPQLGAVLGQRHRQVGRRGVGGERGEAPA